MKYCFYALLFAIVITMCPTHSAFAQQKNYKIVAIDEAPGRTMDAGLFATADPEAVKKYMPEGKVPASVTTFVLFAGEDTILFDAGNGNELWVKKLTDAGVKPENVKFIFLTHRHGDHIGGLFQNETRRFPHAKVLCSKPEYESLAKVKSAYGQDFTTFNFEDEVFANTTVKVKALDAVGHTPGHTAFLIESQGDKLLIVGDLLHAAALQFPVPEACARFDMDHEKAVAARKRILEGAAKEKYPIAGMHFPSPYIGKVEKNDQGGYIFHVNVED